MAAKKRRKYDRNASFRRWQNIRMRALPVDMMVLCGPIDTFFKNIIETGQVDDVQDKAVFDDRWFNRYVGIATAGVGFIDALDILCGIRQADAQNLKPLRSLFADIDTGKEYTEKEVIAAYDAWQWAKKMVGDSRLGEITMAIDRFHEREKVNNGITQ